MRRPATIASILLTAAALAGVGWLAMHARPRPVLLQGGSDVLRQRRLVSGPRVSALRAAGALGDQKLDVNTNTITIEVGDPFSAMEFWKKQFAMDDVAFTSDAPRPEKITIELIDIKTHAHVGTYTLTGGLKLDRPQDRP